VIVGDPSTGKTSLLHQYIYEKFSIAYRPTVSFLSSFVASYLIVHICVLQIPLDFHSTELTCYDAKYKLHLWDTAGK